jgi:hypothetical protein
VVGTRSRAIRRGTSIDANKSHIRWTRVSGHGRSRKRASSRATPERAPTMAVGRELHGFPCVDAHGRAADYRGFLPKSPAGLTVVAGVFVGAADAGFWETPGVGVAAGRFALSFVITDSLKS